MFPVLFSIGPVTIYTLSFLTAIGFLLSSFLTWRRLRNLGLEEEKVLDLILAQAFWGFVFSRVGYILIHFKDFGFFLTRWILIGRFPGLTFWGAMVGGILVLIRFCKKNNRSFWPVADEIAFSYLPLMVLIQIGCFFDGCLRGIPTSLPWGMFFPNDFIRRQPLALYNSVFFFLIWLFLLRAERRWRTWSWYKSSAEGFISLSFLSLALATSFLLAFLEDGGLYYLWFKKIATLFGLLAILIIFYRRSEIKIEIRKPNEIN